MGSSDSYSNSMLLGHTTRRKLRSNRSIEQRDLCIFEHVYQRNHSGIPGQIYSLGRWWSWFRLLVIVIFCYFKSIWAFFNIKGRAIQTLKHSCNKWDLAMILISSNNIICKSKEFHNAQSYNSSILLLLSLLDIVKKVDPKTGYIIWQEVVDNNVEVSELIKLYP